MQPFLAVATLVAALAVAVNSETAYILAPVSAVHHNHNPRILTTGWGWRPVKTVSLALPSISRGWGWGGQKQSGWGKPSGVSIGVYGGIRIGPKQQGGWGKPQGGWGWPKPQGWGWQPQHHQQQQGWGWKQQGWGWDDDDDDEDDYRSTVPALYDGSSEEIADDEASGSVESDESVEDDSPIDYRNAISYDPIYV